MKKLFVFFVLLFSIYFDSDSFACYTCKESCDGILENLDSCLLYNVNCGILKHFYEFNVKNNCKCFQYQECPVCQECLACPACQECQEYPVCQECLACPACPACQECQECPVCQECDNDDDNVLNTKLEYTGGGGCSLSNIKNNLNTYDKGFMFIGIILVLFSIMNFISRRIMISVILFTLGILLYSSSFVLADTNRMPSDPLKLSSNLSLDYYKTKSANTLKHLDFSFGAVYYYSHLPTQIVKKPSNDHFKNIVSSKSVLELNTSIGLYDKLEVGLSFPVVLSQFSENLNYLGYTDYDSVNSSGLEDLRLDIKLNLFSYKMFNFAIAAPYTFPTSVSFPESTDDYLFGEDNVTFSPQIISEIYTKYINTSVNVGFLFRENNDFDFLKQKVNVSNAMFVSVGLKIPLLKNKIDFLNDNMLTMTNFEEFPLESLFGLRFHMPHGFTFNAAAGPGFTKQIGSPNFRVLASLNWGQLVKPCNSTINIIKPEKCMKCKEKIVKIFNEEKMIKLYPVYFAFDKSYVIPQSIPMLDETAKILKNNLWINSVLIVGHTDSKGSIQYNLLLGTRRSKWVRNYLIKKGVEKERLLNITFGEEYPYDTNFSVPGRSRNRRVEFEIEKTYSDGKK